MNQIQEVIVSLIRENALEETANNAGQVLALYCALIEHKMRVVTTPADVDEVIQDVEKWLFQCIRNITNRPDLTNEQIIESCLRLVNPTSAPMQ